MLTNVVVEVDWGAIGDYADESAYVVSASGQARLAPPASFIASPRGQVDMCTVVFSNYSSHFVVGAGVQIQSPIRVSIVMDAVTTRVFTGVVSAVEFSTNTPAHPSTMTVQCKSRDYAVLQSRNSSSNNQFRTWVDDPPTEEEIIAAWLHGAGFTDGQDYVSQRRATIAGETATLDPGMFRLRWAWMDDESNLEECWQVAAACGGRLYCDASGIMRYENMQRWALGGSSTALGRGDFVDLSIGYSDAEVYDTITIEASGRTVQPAEFVWQPDETIVLPASASGYEVIARLNQPLYRYDGLVYTAVSGGGLSMAANVSIASTTLYSQRVVYTFDNSSTTHAAVLANMKMVGQVADGQRAEETTATSSETFWVGRYSRSRSVRNNPYVQSLAQAQALAQMLADWHDLPRISGTLTGTADPTIGVGELIELTDATLIVAPGSEPGPRDFYVLGVSWTANNAGYNASLQIMDATALYPYQSTTPGYFVIGTSELGAADAQRGRLFY